MMPTSAYRHLEARTEQGVLVLTITEPHVEGDALAEDLREDMLAALARAGQPRGVVVDFQRTRFISSMAFRPLLSLRRKLQEQGGRLLVCGLSPTVGSVFFNTRLASESGSFQAIFEMEADVAAAVARLNRSAAERP
jgi:anti-anti-sigma factor